MPITHAPTRKPKTTASVRTAGFGFFFVAVREPLHRFDDPAALFGDGQGIDKIGRERAAAGERDVQRVAAGDVVHDLIRVPDVIVVAGRPQHERHDAAEVHFDVERQVQRPGQARESAIRSSALPMAGRRMNARCSGRVQSMPRFTATMSPVMHRPTAMTKFT